MKRARCISAAAVVPLVLSGVITPAIPHAAATQPSHGCAPIHVIQAAGTGSTYTWPADAREALFEDGTSAAADLATMLGTQNVTTHQVSYPATLGRFDALGSAQDGAGSVVAATYGESVIIGHDDALNNLTSRAASCPDTKFIMVGYSQGAHLIGDVAAEAAAGEVAGVDALRIAAVALFADPAKAPLGQPAEPSRPAHLYAPAPQGVRGQNFETVQSGGTPLAADRVGLAGSRGRTFNGLEGKVLSLCNAGDMACATPPDSELRTVADVAMRETYLDAPTAATSARLKEFHSQRNTGANPRTALQESGLGVSDAVIAGSILNEVALTLGALDRKTAGTSPPDQRLAVALLSTLPNLAKEGVTWPYLLKAADGLVTALPDGPVKDWAALAVEMMRATHAVETLYLQLAYIGLIPRQPTGTEGRQVFVHATVQDGVDRLAAFTGLDAVMRAHPSLVESAQLAGDFGPRHMSYYRLGSDTEFNIDGMSGYDYTMDWLASVGRGVLATN